MFFNKKKKDNRTTITEYLHFKVINTDPKVLKRLSKYDNFSVYLGYYNSNRGIKVITQSDDEIIGDIIEDKVSELIKLNIKTGNLYIENKLSNDGVMEYSCEYICKRYISVSPEEAVWRN